jgi:hypothetical protein
MKTNVKAMTQIFRLHCFLLTTATADRWSRDQRVKKREKMVESRRRHKSIIYIILQIIMKIKLKNLFFILKIGKYYLQNIYRHILLILDSIIAKNKALSRVSFPNCVHTTGSAQRQSVFISLEK